MAAASEASMVPAGVRAAKQAYRAAVKRASTNAELTAIDVLPGLYLGSIGTAVHTDQLRANGITHVLTVATGIHPDIPLSIQHKVVSAIDAPSFDIMQALQECGEFLDSCLKQPNGRVLVHCFAGRSRSVTIVVAYLMTRLNMTLTDASVAVTRCRAFAKPNPGFIAQLMRLQHFQFQAGASQSALLAASAHHHAVPLLSYAPHPLPLPPSAAAPTASTASYAVAAAQQPSSTAQQRGKRAIDAVDDTASTTSSKQPLSTTAPASSSAQSITTAGTLAVSESVSARAPNSKRSRGHTSVNAAADCEEGQSPASSQLSNAAASSQSIDSPTGSDPSCLSQPTRETITTTTTTTTTGTTTSASASARSSSGESPQIEQGKPRLEALSSHIDMLRQASTAVMSSDSEAAGIPSTSRRRTAKVHAPVAMAASSRISPRRVTSFQLSTPAAVPTSAGLAVMRPRPSHSMAASHYAMIQPSRLLVQPAGASSSLASTSIEPTPVTMAVGAPRSPDIPMVMMKFVGPGILRDAGEYSSGESDAHVPPRALGASLHSSAQAPARVESAQAATLAYSQHSVALPFPRAPVSVVPVPVSTTDLLPRVIEATHKLLQLATVHAQARYSTAVQTK